MAIRPKPLTRYRLTGPGVDQSFEALDHDDAVDKAIAIFKRSELHPTVSDRGRHRSELHVVAVLDLAQ